MHQIARDDLEDVKELTEKLSNLISETLSDTHLHIAMSALISAISNSIIQNSDSKMEAHFYRKTLNDMLETMIKQNPLMWI